MSKDPNNYLPEPFKNPSCPSNALDKIRNSKKPNTDDYKAIKRFILALLNEVRQEYDTHPEISFEIISADQTADDISLNAEEISAPLSGVKTILNVWHRVRVLDSKGNLIETIMVDQKIMPDSIEDDLKRMMRRFFQSLGVAHAKHEDIK